MGTKGKVIHIGTISFVLILLFSCSGLKKAKLSSQLEKNNCNHEEIQSYTAEDLPKPLHSIALDTVLTNRFSLRSLNISNAVGLLEPLSDYVNLKQSYAAEPSLEKRIALVELSQQINQKINIFSIEISAIAGEMDCEEERADQIASYLTGKEAQAESRMTVGAISAGILLANGDDDNTPELIGIGAGLTEATLGVLILTNKRKVNFYHKRNALRDIWSGPTVSTIFPPAVWYYLTYTNPSDNEPSIRQQLVDKWLGFGQIADTKEKNKTKIYNLFFGKGGKYTANQLTNRANMHDQIEAQINLMSQDLKLLALEIENLDNDAS